MSNEKPNPFILIKHVGEPNKAEFRGVAVVRKNALYTDISGLIPCTPYDNHFIFEVPENHIGPAHMCTCGSEAVIAFPLNMYVCMFYHSRLAESGHGYHQTAVVNKDSFETVAGQTIELPEVPKWLI